MDDLERWIDALHAATHFREAGAHLLEAVLDRVVEAAPSGWTGLRGWVHLRPRGDVEGLALVERAAGATARAPDPRPSATAWRWVRDGGCAAWVDVLARRVHLADPSARLDAGGAPGARTPLPLGDPERPGQADFRSQDQVLARLTTHLLALPLWASRGGLVGVLTLELRAADGAPGWAWREVLPALRRLARLAVPALLDLPRGSAAAPPEDPLLPVVGRAMAAVVEDLRILAPHEGVILLRGPTGVGKSQLARWLYAQSPRSGGPFVQADLHKGPDDRQEARLVGWRRGAFTGADRDHPGRLARAQGGTLFIDEVDKLSLAAQTALLHVLDDGAYTPLGGDRVHRADAQILVGTNADLEAAVTEGRFLEDLYYRVSVFPVRIPPLAERLDEIVPWARTMARALHAKRQPGSAATLSEAAGARLVAQPWPGNLRQLHSAVRRAYAYAFQDARRGEVCIDVAHVERALALQTAPPRPGGLPAALQAAADAFVSEAERRHRARQPPLDLDHTRALAGWVVDAALARADARTALTWLGRAKTHDQGNLQKLRRHHAERRRALERLLAGDG